MSSFFIVKNNKIILNNFNSEDSNNPQRAVYVYPGIELTTDNVKTNLSNNKHISVNIKISNSTSISIENILELLNENVTNGLEDIILYFDSGCKQPFELGKQVDGGYEIYQHNAISGKKIKDKTKEDEIEDGRIVYKNYEILYKFKYSESISYQLEFVKEWYNVNTYIKCDKILNKKDKKYLINVKTFSSSNSSNTLNNNSGDAIYYADDRIIDDRAKVGSIREHIGPNSNNELVISTSGSGFSNSLLLGSLFTTNQDTINNEFKLKDNNKIYNNNNSFSYKLFSFNFKIPKVGWDKLNDIMYAKNPYFQTDILKNAESGLIDTGSVELTQLDSIAKSNVIFTGEFSFVYLVLDNRVVEQIVGSGNYRRWWIY